jgi:alginate O-acetyltransferase complex protein AlgF
MVQGPLAYFAAHLVQEFVMQPSNAMRRKLFLASVLGPALLPLNALAQPAGQLYDPEPPADSAYVRVLVVNADAPVDVLVDGRPRSQKINAGEIGDYMVLGAGKHVISVQLSGKTNTLASHTLEVVKGKAMTLAFTSLKPGATPTVFEDKANTNKLKSVVAAYHLDSKAGALDVLTADGNTKVFTNLAYGVSNSIQVNPISVELIASKTGEKSSQTSPPKTTLSMAQGATYSVFLMPNHQGNLIAKTAMNKTERYVGK